MMVDFGDWPRGEVLLVFGMVVRLVAVVLLLVVDGFGTPGCRESRPIVDMRPIPADCVRLQLNKS